MERNPPNYGFSSELWAEMTESDRTMLAEKHAKYGARKKKELRLLEKAYQVERDGR